jgi:RNA polymerase sigma-70 factor (ECF subfamily)
MADDTAECGLESRAETLDEDQPLVCAARQDPEAAGRLYDKHYARIFGYIYHCTLDVTAAEDLTSNVFLAALTHLERFRWRQVPFQAWLFRIATNEVRAFYRRHKYAKAACLQRSHDCSTNSAPSADEGPAVTEAYRLVHQALLELRPKYREVIILRYFEDRTIGEISEITGAREGTIKSQLHRGLFRLQGILARRRVLPE